MKVRQNIAKKRGKRKRGTHRLYPTESGGPRGAADPEATLHLVVVSHPFPENSPTTPLSLHALLGGNYGAKWQKEVEGGEKNKIELQILLMAKRGKRTHNTFPDCTGLDQSPNFLLLFLLLHTQRQQSILSYIP